MDWSPDSSSELAIFVAAIGLTGGLAGALIGLVGNYVSTSRQIARQERNVRRDAYLDFLRCRDVFHEIYRRVPDYDKAEMKAEARRIIDQSDAGENVHEDFKALERRVFEAKGSDPATVQELNHAGLSMMSSLNRLRLVAPPDIDKKAIHVLESDPLDPDHQTEESRRAVLDFIEAARRDTRTRVCVCPELLMRRVPRKH